MSIFGARVKTLRLERGWSMKQLGEEISKLSGSPLPQTTVSNWENKGSEPPYNILVFTATVLEVSTDYLLGKTNELTNEQYFLKQNISEDVTIYNEHIDKAKEKNTDTNLNTALNPTIEQLKQELLVLPISKREPIENELNEYLEFLDYKQEKLLLDFKKFSNYIKYQIKNL
ncbi:helix-turn-helix domain-containing protein [Bacillus cytotoxicus]|uniref:Helix-turn-helix domain-containing protein n=1 Tax=Bacillus cytotoxicus TaxID=580165 RepID=A0ACC6A9E8_9BACI|nr:helix-turn-helix domain-containing protein [Bacillus cytotoxicus]